MQAISPVTHSNFVWARVTPSGRADCFAQPHETQDKAIKRFMASRKRAWNNDGRTMDQFPRWSPGMTTADYVARYEAQNKLIRGACDTSRGGALDRPAPYYTSPEVEVSALELEEAI